MKSVTGFLLLAGSLLLGAPAIAAAQQTAAGVHAPPKVLVLIREFLKPGKTVMTHEKTESEFVQAFARANWPEHYFGVDSLSGKPRAVFLVGYDSFEAWEKDNQAVAKDKAVAAALDHAGQVDGDQLSNIDTGVFLYSEEYSLRAPVDIARMRYFEVSVFHVRPGHHKDWDDLVKLVKTGYEKLPDAHWAAFEAAYGAPGGTYLVFTPMKSLAEVDHAFAEGKEFETAMGAQGMQRMRELEAAAVDSSETNLFQFNPRISYPPPAWVQEDPTFWKAKPEGMPAAAPKKPAAKPKE